MDAIALLRQQHRLVERLFERFENTRDQDEREELFNAIADNLAVHATIEERYFYPAVRARQTEQNLDEAYDEHIEVKQLALDAMDSYEEPRFDSQVEELKKSVEHNVEEEESELFPKVKKLLTSDALVALGQRMEAEAAELVEQGEPRRSIRPEAEPPAAPI